MIPGDLPVRGAGSDEQALVEFTADELDAERCSARRRSRRWWHIAGLPLTLNGAVGIASLAVSPVLSEPAWFPM